MADTLGDSASTLSFYLKELLHAVLISQERDGRSLIYRAPFDRMNGLLAYLTAQCRQGEAYLEDPASPACTHLLTGWGR